MRRLGSDKVVHYFSARNAPAYTVGDGETVIVKTRDAFSEQVRSATDLFEDVSMEKVNPATGPIEVAGMRAGDALCVDIHEIKPAPTGIVMCSPELGLLAKDVRRSRTRTVRVEGGKAVFSDELEIDLDPHVGVIGVSPAEGSFPTYYPGDFGGNMDMKEAGEGSKVYLPVFVNGAMVSLGDVHAVMADGEICGTGVEVASELTVRFSRAEGLRLKRPMVETKDAWICYAAAKTLDEAARLAASDMVSFIADASGSDFEEAYMLASLVADLGISQVVDPLMAAKMTIAKKYL